MLFPILPFQTSRYPRPEFDIRRLSMLFPYSFSHTRKGDFQTNLLFLSPILSFLRSILPPFSDQVKCSLPLRRGGNALQPSEKRKNPPFFSTHEIASCGREEGERMLFRRVGLELARKGRREINLSRLPICGFWTAILAMRKENLLSYY